MPTFTPASDSNRVRKPRIIGCINKRSKSSSIAMIISFSISSAAASRGVAAFWTGLSDATTLAISAV